MIKPWFFAVITVLGVVEGKLRGEKDEGETEEEAKQKIALFVRNYVSHEGIGAPIIAVFVSESEMYIDSPGAVLTHINITEIYSPPVQI